MRKRKNGRRWRKGRRKKVKREAKKEGGERGVGWTLFFEVEEKGEKGWRSERAGFVLYPWTRLGGRKAAPKPLLFLIERVVVELMGEQWRLEQLLYGRGGSAGLQHHADSTWEDDQGLGIGLLGTANPAMQSDLRCSVVESSREGAEIWPPYNTMTAYSRGLPTAIPALRAPRLSGKPRETIQGPNAVIGGYWESSGRGGHEAAEAPEESESPQEAVKHMRRPCKPS